MKISKAISMMIIFSILFLLTGCAENVIYHSVVQGYPEMEKRYQTLSDVGKNDARLILYWPEKSFIEGISVRVMIDGDNGSMHADIGFRTAELIDLPSGIYHIGFSKSKNKIQLDAQPGIVYCYNISELKAWSSNTDDQKTPRPVQIEKCINDFTKDDIRCAHKECLVKTVVPKKLRKFKLYKPGTDNDQLENGARNFNIDNKVCRIYITRRMYTLGWVRVGIDGKPEVKMASSSFVVYQVKPGEHTVVASIGGPHNIEQAYRIYAKPGRCYFFHSDNFKFLSETQGRELIHKYDLIDEGFFIE